MSKSHKHKPHRLCSEKKKTELRIIPALWSGGSGHAVNDATLENESQTEEKVKLVVSGRQLNKG